MALSTEWVALKTGQSGSGGVEYSYESFLKTFKQLPDYLEEFSFDSWNIFVEYTTIYSTDDILFTFKHGQEIKAYKNGPSLDYAPVVR